MSMKRPQFRERPPNQAHLAPWEWIKLHYSTEIESGELHRGIIHRNDLGLYEELRKYERNHTLPADFVLPTLPEWNTKQLNEIGKLNIAALLKLLRKVGDSKTRKYIRLHEVAKKRPKPDAV